MLFHVVVNPAGASGWTGLIWRRLEPVFRSSGRSYQVHYSTPEHGIEEIVRELTASEEEVALVVVGGDGTMNQAVNGIRDFAKVKIGYIPAGSGNDLGRGLKLQGSRAEIARTILQGEVRRKMDVGEIVCHGRTDLLKFNTHETDRSFIEGDWVRRFNVSSGMGFDAAICKEAEWSRAKKWFNRIRVGKLIYGFVCIRLIVKFQRFAAEVALDGGSRRVHYPESLFNTCMIHPYEGGGFAFCPDADGQDGILDTCFVEGLTQKEVLQVMPGVNHGSHLHCHGVHLGRIHDAEITTSVPVWVHTDGEVACKSSHVTFRLLDAQLSYLQ
jgi:diacylglycerol kinase family enzyme